MLDWINNWYERIFLQDKEYFKRMYELSCEENKRLKGELQAYKDYVYRVLEEIPEPEEEEFDYD